MSAANADNLDCPVGQEIWRTTTDGKKLGTYAESAVRTFAWTVALEHGHNSTRPVEVIIRTLPNDQAEVSE